MGFDKIYVFMYVCICYDDGYVYSAHTRECVNAVKINTV